MKDLRKKQLVEACFFFVMLFVHGPFIAFTLIGLILFFPWGPTTQELAPLLRWTGFLAGILLLSLSVMADLTLRKLIGTKQYLGRVRRDFSESTLP